MHGGAQPFCTPLFATGVCAGRSGRNLSFERHTGAERAAPCQISAARAARRLGLSSTWDVGKSANSGEELPAQKKHDHVDLVMSNGKVLRYTGPAALAPGNGPARWKGILRWHILAQSHER